MSEASRWLDGFFTAGCLLGLRPSEVAEMLPHDITPGWAADLDLAPSRKARAARLAAQAFRLSQALEPMRPRWR